jgi:hypothetical protein
VPRIGRSILALVVLALWLPASASGQAAYTVPADNPFVGTPGAAPEIYALGLRNPFRFSFDRATGDLTIGDVGQAAREEIDFVPAGGARGANFEWACREGLTTGPKASTCPALTNPVPPVFDYPNPAGDAASITGGVVIRDPSMPSFVGRYVYADYFELPLKTIALATPTGSDDQDEAAGIGGTVAFGEDAVGGVYAVSLTGDVYKLGEGAGGVMTATLITGDPVEPMNLAAPPGDASRVFIVEQRGRVILRTGGANSTFLDIESQVSDDPGERGMSSVAFAPDYASSGRFYVYYTTPGNEIRVDEFRRSAGNPNVADASTQRNVLRIDHSMSNNHYGGDMEFGPDGYLYIATGDGGGGNDVFNQAQNRGTLLGKLLRIDPRAPAAPPPAAGAPADTRPPRFRTKTKRRQRVLRLGGVVVYARCPAEACRVSMNARLRIGRLSYPLRRVRRTLKPNRQTRLRARLQRRARRALRGALRDRTRARVDVGLRARDAAGNRTSLRRVTVRVRRR